MVINGGDTWTNRAQVTLELSASDDTAVSEMCVTSRATCTSWIAYQTPYTYTISGTGAKTVSVWFRDTYSNVTAAPATDSIIVDNVRPVNGAVSTSGASGEVTVSWSGYSDAISGIASYRVMRAEGTTAPTTCATGTPIYDGADSSYLDTGLTDGTTYAYRVCAVDNATNTSTGTAKASLMVL